MEEVVIGLQLCALAVAYADARRGLREAGGDNKGVYVQFMLENAGIDVPAPWCAAWVQDIYDSAAWALGILNPLDAVELEAYVPSYHQWAAERGRLITKAGALRPGDLVFFNFGGQRWDHIGILRAPPSALTDGATFGTIEGNTNEDGSREGYMVAKKSRRFSPGRVAFARVE